MTGPVGAVLVVGGGISGTQSALDLADSGYKVYMLESRPSIGGVMAALDKTFPTNDCSMCIMAPKLVGAGRHPNIEIITNADLLGISGSAGNFKARIMKRPRYVRTELCTGCGVCAQKCPTKVSSEFDRGLSKRKAIFIEFPQAVPLKYAIDRARCIYFKTGKCGLCKKNCPAGAIDYEMKPEEVELEIGSVIMSPGFEPYSPPAGNEYGYGVFKNVVTSMEFERILSASGPYAGHVQRPSDGSVPMNIAFIQCVGSRDTRTNSYCSAVCCMYATKEAIIAKEHTHGLDATIFFMDMRAFGKEFDYFYVRAREEYGVRYVRSRVPAVSELPNGNLRIKYESEMGQMKQEDFDMVVLSIALCPPAGISELAKKTGVKLDGDGFIATGTFSPMETNVPGIFVSGAVQGPKDIPDTVAQASGAAALAARVITSERGKLVIKKEYPSESDVLRLRPRIGVFVCHCGINIGGVVNVPEVTEYAATLPNVVHVENNLYSCSQDAQSRIREKIKEHRLNRVVVASCTPRTHEPLFQETCKEAGLNAYLFEMANIRDQCSWVHMHQPKEATAKAKALVRAAVAKARTLQPLPRKRIDVKKSALVIGGGISGMYAAFELASHGIQVTLVEREASLGGLMRSMQRTIDGEDITARLRTIEDGLRSNGLINIHTDSKIKSIDGYLGNFRTVVAHGALGTKTESTVEHGAVIIATGGREHKPEEHLYGKDPRVMTQLEFEQKHSTGALPPLKTVVMIQCVGSRNEKRGYCSRVCCTVAVKNALLIRKENPDARIFVLYRDMRTYGRREEWFQEARAQGIEFLRHEDKEIPVVSLDGGALKVTTREPVLNRTLILRPDIIVLSSGLLPPEGSVELAKMLKVPISRDGFFLEAHMKLRPVEFATGGVHLCGVCHSPKFIDESISQAEAAAMKTIVLLQAGYIESEPYISEIREDKCSGCQMCLRVCP